MVIAALGLAGLCAKLYVDEHSAVELLKKYAGYAKDSLAAKLPENGKFDVVFAEEALDTLSFISAL